MIDLLKQGCVEYGVYEGQDDTVVNLAKLREQEGQSWTLLMDDDIWAVGGFDFLWEGVAEAWAMLSPDVAANPLGVIRIFRGVISDKLTQYHRIQCHVRHDLYAALRFVQALGFVEEGTNRKFTADGVDCIEFAKVN
jgi:hypothetical protein